MKKNILIFTFSLSFMLFSCENYTPEKLAGTYISNYDELPEHILTPPESPGRKDTLILFKDTTYTSRSFGTDRYRLSMSRGTMYISLSSYTMPIMRKGLFNNKIIFEIGDNYYYEKVD